MKKGNYRLRTRNIGKSMIVLTLAIISFSILAGCQGRTSAGDHTEKSEAAEPEGFASRDESAVQETEDVQENEAYSVVNSEGGTLESRFSVPEGYERIECGEEAFGVFLRNYALLPDGQQVLLYNGEAKGRQKDHAAVFDMDLVEGDLQQCADSVLRLYAEYFYETKQYSRMNFQLSNGFLLSFDKWSQGMRVSVNGNDTSWVSSAQASDSQESFEGYLKFLFSYAGTLSMGRECSPADLAEVQPGDVFLYSGSPGHVVMVLDVCENAEGQRAFLLGQGYMPAQQFHVLKNPAHEEDPWYYTDEITYPFLTPEYTFDEGSFMRPVYLQ